MDAARTVGHAAARVVNWARFAGRLVVTACLVVLYSLGYFVGSLTIIGSGSWAAVRLGWSDVRKQGTHGDA